MPHADRPRVRCERPAGVEPAPPNWQAGVQPGTPWAREPRESRAGLEPARAPGCSRWPYHLGDLDRRADHPGWWLTTTHPDWPTRRRRRESNSRSACARRRSGPMCRTDRHLVSGQRVEESGGIEPLTRRSRWFSGPVPHHEARSPIGVSLRAAKESNLAGRFWRPARSQIATHCLSGRTRTCVDLLPRQVGNHYPTPRYWVTGRFRSGTAAFTARHAEPLHHGHHGQVEAGGLAPSSRAYHARALLLSYASRLGARPGVEPGDSGSNDNPLQSALTDRARLARRDQSGALH